MNYHKFHSSPTAFGNNKPICKIRQNASESYLQLSKND